ncbi:MAG: patatin-like phospholipase family protein, partial [Bacteroidia bacterium]
LKFGNMKQVHLVLGSGGARGMAHIGVIEGLLEEGFEIVDVVGCSMGAVVGGIYSAGYLQAYSDWLRGLTKSTVFGLTDFTFTTQGFIKGEKIFQKIQELTGDQNIEELEIPFTAIATDMIRRKEVLYRSGNLFTALRASVSIPGVFVPVIDKNRLLVDGGVLNPLPINHVKKNKDAIIVAVNINALAPNDNNIAQVAKEPASFLDNEFMNKYFSNFVKPKTKAKQKIPQLSVFELVNTSYDYTQDRLAEVMEEIYKPEILVHVPRTSCGTFEFYRAEEMIQMGKEAFQLALKEYRKTN